MCESPVCKSLVVLVSVLGLLGVSLLGLAGLAANGWLGWYGGRIGSASAHGGGLVSWPAVPGPCRKNLRKGDRKPNTRDRH